jgi:hypothetical protein
MTVTEPKVNILEGKLIVDWTSTTWLTIFTTLIIHQIVFFFTLPAWGAEIIDIHVLRIIKQTNL